MQHKPIAISTNLEAAFHATWNAIASRSFCRTNDDAIALIVVDADLLLEHGNVAAYVELNSLISQYDLKALVDALADRLHLLRPKNQRYRIFFPMCREGQSHSDFLFATDDLTTASAWASMFDCFVVTDSLTPGTYVF